MADVDLLVVGAGPHALTLMTYLARYAPGVFHRTVVVDPNPWLGRWDTQFSALEIPMLRSACVHHPDPDPYALIDFAKASDRSDELHGPLGRPGTALFSDFCTHLLAAHDLQKRLITACVQRLEARLGTAHVTLSDGRRIEASRVVVATNPVTPVLPAWMHAARSRHPGEPGLCHSGQFPLTQLDSADRLVVVGGGLTAAQVVEGAARKGVSVTWINACRASGSRSGRGTRLARRGVAVLPLGARTGPPCRHRSARTWGREHPSARAGASDVSGTG